MGKWVKIGQVVKKKDKDGTVIRLGDTRNSKYSYSVDIRVTDSTGEVVYESNNPFVQVQDPRNRKGITEEQASKIPDFILFDLFVVEEE